LIRTSYFPYETLLIKINRSAVREALRFFPTERFPVEKLVSNAIKECLDSCKKVMLQRCEQAQDFFHHPKGIAPPGEVQYPISCSSCSITGQLEDTRYLNCFQWVSDPTKQLNMICLGKFDFILVQPFPHSWWTNVFRTHLFNFRSNNVSVFKEIMNIPSYRVIQSDVESKDIAPITMNYPDLHYLLPIIFLKFKETSLKKDNEYLQQVASSVLELRNRRTPRVKLMEFFLTFSHYYPAFLITDFRDHGELTELLYELKELENVCDTSTMMAIKSENLSSKPKRKEKSFYSLLLKGNKNNSRVLAKTIKRELKEQSIIQCFSQIIMLQRGYYWDVLLLFRTHKLYKLTKYLTENLIYNQDVKDSVTVPYLHWKKHKLSFKLMFGDKKKLIYDTSCEAPVDKKIHASKWEMNEQIFAMWSKRLDKISSLDNSPKYPAWDIYNFQVYDLIFDLQWMFGYIHQLHLSWLEWDLEDKSTFHLAKECIVSIIERIHLTIYGTVLEKFYDEANEIDRDLQKYFSQELERARKLEKPIKEPYEKGQMIWAYLKKFKKESDNIKLAIHSLSMQLMERLESRQLTSNTEPHIHFGQKAGILDLTYSAVTNLFLDYSSHSDPEISGIRSWDGLVLLSDRRTDFAINSEMQILFLPIDFKLHVHEKLLLVSHEAAHYILRAISNQYIQNGCSQAYSDLLALLDPVVQRAITDMKEILHEARKSGDISHIKMKQSLEEILSDVEQYISKRRIPSEIMADLLGCIAAGPRYLRSMALLAYSPPVKDWNWPLRRRPHPTAWLRTYLGLHFFETLDCDARWTYGMKEGLNDMVTKHQGVPFDRSYEIKLLHCLSMLEMKDVLLGTFNNHHLLHDHKFYIIRAMLQEGEAFYTNLVQWAEKYLGAGYLFFPLEQNMREMSATIFVKCKSLSERLHVNSELLLDERPKYIAAASVLSPIRRPAYPSGRILHSLAYCRGERNRN